MWLTHTHVHGNNHVYTGLIGIGLKFSWIKQRTRLSMARPFVQRLHNVTISCHNSLTS